MLSARLLPLMALAAAATDMRGLPANAKLNVRLDDALMHAQFPVFCPECFNERMTSENLYLVCDLQISRSGDDVEPAFMLNGHYVPEWYFERHSEDKWEAHSRGVGDPTIDSPARAIKGTLHYETIVDDGSIDIKGVMFNMSSSTSDASYSVRISYERKPVTRIIRISQMDPVANPFHDKMAWIDPPAYARYAQIAQQPVIPAYMYGELPATGSDCTSLSCKSRIIAGKGLNKVDKLKGKASANKLPSVAAFSVVLLVIAIVARRYVKSLGRSIRLNSPITPTAFEARWKKWEKFEKA